LTFPLANHTRSMNDHQHYAEMQTFGDILWL